MFIQDLLQSPHVSGPTRRALQTRLDTPPVSAPRCLTPHEFRTLQSICGRLLPDPGSGLHIDIAGLIDARLADNQSDGWRYDTLPDDQTTLRQALAALDAATSLLFAEAPPETQDAILQAVQSGAPPGPPWPFPPERFFEELLAEATEIYFAHPLAQDAIAYAGMADRPSWTRIGLNEHEDREP